MLLTNQIHCDIIYEQKEAESPFSPRNADSSRVNTVNAVCDTHIRCFMVAVEKLLSRIFCFQLLLIQIWGCFTIIKNSNSNGKEHEINEAIGFPDNKNIRLISDSGEQFGIMTFAKALELAEQRDLDLVLMSAQSEPPVCKIMDYGKFRFERDKREKEAKKKQKVIEVKEIQLTCLIDTNDFNTKVNHARRFLTDGNRVRVMVKFRGRQMARQDGGLQLLERFSTACADLGAPEKAPVFEGRNMIMFIAPVKQTAAK